MYNFAKVVANDLLAAVILKIMGMYDSVMVGL